MIERTRDHNGLIILQQFGWRGRYQFPMDIQGETECITVRALDVKEAYSRAHREARLIDRILRETNDAGLRFVTTRITYDTLTDDLFCIEVHTIYVKMSWGTGVGKWMILLDGWSDIADDSDKIPLLTRVVERIPKNALNLTIERVPNGTERYRWVGDIPF